VLNLAQVEFRSSAPVPVKFLGIVGQDPSDSKSTRLHVDIFRCCFIHLRYLLIDSSKMIGDSPEVSDFNWLFAQTQPVYL